MNYIENIYICLMAPLLIAILFLRKEARRTLIFLLAGMTSCLLSAYISSYISGVVSTDATTVAVEITPIVEEIMKLLPLLLFVLVFEPDKKTVISGAVLIAVGFATFENVCYLISYGSSELLLLFIRGFGTGAMHVVCGMIVAIGVYYLWNQTWLQLVGAFALLSFITIFHAVFNIFVNQTGVVFWIGTGIPHLLVLIYLVFIRKRIALI